MTSGELTEPRLARIRPHLRHFGIRASRLLFGMRLLYTGLLMKQYASFELKHLFQSVALAVAFVSLCCGCQTTVNNPNLASQAAPPPRATLAPGDVIKLTFTGTPE